MPVSRLSGFLIKCCRVVAVLLGTSILIASAACGSDSVSPSFPSTPGVSASVAAGQQFTCALTSDGKSYCWGDNLKGQLGDSSFVPQLVPAPTAGGHQFAAIAAAAASACALDHEGTAWCWGDDPTQPGVPLSYRTSPVAVSSPRPFKSITVGAKFGCGLDVDGAAFCWGINSQGQLGVGDTVRRTGATAVQTSLRFASITADFFSACGLTNAGTAWCWGDNQFGELGTGDIASSTTPRAVSGSMVFRVLSSGPIHECGLTAAGAAFCWGNNAAGQLGDGTGTTRTVPTAVVGNLSFTSIRSARVNSIFSTTCGVTSSGDAYCWGYGSKGQLGTASASNACTPFSPAGVTNTNPVTFACSYRPAKISGISSVVALDVGLEHVCAITSAPLLVCWGDGAHGELGDGNGVAEATPVQVKGGLPLP
jgi:alpha-tubulin suppressor-like RCC1 family protein